MSEPNNALVVPDLANVETPEKSGEAALQALGIEFQDAIERSKGICLQKAWIVHRAWSIYCSHGRQSQFGTWVSRYTDLSRTQAHRLRLVVECFAQAALNCSRMEQKSKLSEVEEGLKNIKLTALFALSSPSTPPEARSEAILEAKNGVVTPGRALEIIEKHTVPVFASLTPARTGNAAGKKAHRLVIDVDGGKVTVSAPDGDLVKVLRTALKKLERQA